MIKKIIAIFLSIIFLIVKKIFVREHSVPHKIMDPIANTLHSLFIYSSFIGLYLSTLEIEIYSYSLSSIIYLVLFIQFVITIRYFNKDMLIEKQSQVKLITVITKLSLFIFIVNWIFFSFGFAVAFLLIVFINNIFYKIIINQIKKQKEQEEFKKQFGEGNYSKDDIIQKHIQNLFESNISLDQLSKSDIKKQYRQMAKKYHPDVYDGSDDKFVSINSSYNYLMELIDK
jgi:hypothetical protein